MAPERILSWGNEKMNWFERITGFSETDYDRTQARLRVVDGRLHSSDSSRSWAVGDLSMPSLAELRSAASSLRSGRGPIRVEMLQGDVRRLHVDPQNALAMFQVASQFNLLEMVGPSVSPEDGVTRYESDRTQGPACAIAAGAGTIYRNYFLPVQGRPGQRRDRQVDTLSDLGQALGNVDGSLWQMRNGYCMVTDESLAAVDEQLAGLDRSQLQDLSGLLRIGVHANVEVTDPGGGHLVHQAYCSALPVAYNGLRDRRRWERFARLILDAAYEATLLAALVQQTARKPPLVYLTLLGGGAFGNDLSWILDAMYRALRSCADAGLDVRIVSYREPPQELVALVSEFRR